jgi:predicted enzyme involved in methoxymalonyl-ACP biosynthesis
MVTMRDRFGAYGQIGLVLLDAGADAWTIRLLLTSCRVASRGVGGIVLRWLTAEAAAAGMRLLAHFVPNDRNRIMGITFRLAGFREHERRGDLVVFEHPLDRVPPVPSFVRLEVEQRVMAEIGEMR